MTKGGGRVGGGSVKRKTDFRFCRPSAMGLEVSLDFFDPRLTAPKKKEKKGGVNNRTACRLLVAQIEMDERTS